MLSACVKRINEFSKFCKKKKHLEADLIIYVLDVPFSYPAKFFGTCFTAFDYRTGLLVKRLTTLVEKKLHPDYKINYIERINFFLERLHSTSEHIDFIFVLPKKIE